MLILPFPEGGTTEGSPEFKDDLLGSVSLMGDSSPAKADSEKGIGGDFVS